MSEACGQSQHHPDRRARSWRVGIIVGGYLLGDGLRRARMADRAVTMRGLAERDVTADLATWTTQLHRAGHRARRGPGRDRARHAHRRRLLPRRRLSGQGGDRRAAARSASFYDSNRRPIRHHQPPPPAAHHRRDAGAARLCPPVRPDPRRRRVQEGSDMVYIFTRLNAIKPRDDRRRRPRTRAAAPSSSRSDSRHRRRRHPLGDPGLFLDRRARRRRDTGEGGGGGDSPLQKVRVVTTIEFYLD